MMIGKILRFGRSRQLHTITSRETIKPSSPTPSHLRTYNLSMVDQCMSHVYMPLILFYPNNENCSLTAHEKAREMKKSLSESLTRYYPLAGRLITPTTPYIDCNDEGIVFVEAKHDCHIDKGQLISEEYAGVGQLFADGMVWQNSTQSTSLLAVQLNHFACGGMGVALSMSHKVGDGCSLVSFASHWASIARYGSTDHRQVLALNPHFIQSQSTTENSFPSATGVLNPSVANRVIRKFVFPNSKLSELKKKVLGMAELGGSKLSINDNPTRSQVLTSLIYKTVVEATSSRSSPFMPSLLFIPVNLRDKFVPRLPQTTFGNLVTTMSVMTRHESETSLSALVSAIQKAKMEVKQLPSLQQASQDYISNLSSLGKEDLETFVNRSYWYSSMCGFPYFKIDFGWGKPTFASVPLGCLGMATCVLMDTPNGDGIVAQVNLETQHMEIFQNDKELLSFCQI
ncbi:akuammiline synthase 1-like [Bidens hawaiensis]|uniref:akuammiline synthase 1-like n=1 Tax=Bidens hawaiensis TaxID=980011 RepID=UPI00404A1183